jgi:hypothetical protein
MSDEPITRRDWEQFATKKDLEISEYRISAKFNKELFSIVKWITFVLMGFGTIILVGVYFVVLAHWKP